MMKNKKLWFKLLLDGLMLIALTLLFWKENFGMSFHEIVGVSVLGAFLLHLILNWRWVCRITGRFFSRGMTARARVGYLVDAGLLVCFAVIGFSGICMSRTLFRPVSYTHLGRRPPGARSAARPCAPTARQRPWGPVFYGR